MTEPEWMIKAIRMIQKYGNQPDPIERARMESAIYQHFKDQRNAVLETGISAIEAQYDDAVRAYPSDYEQGRMDGLGAASAALSALKQP